MYWRVRFAAVLILLGFLLVLAGYNYVLYTSTKERKYVGFFLNPQGRLGNQLFRLISGYGIARTMGRIHYLPFEKRKCVNKYLVYLEKIFPRLKQTYFLAEKGAKQRLVSFAKTGSSYAEPSRLSNFTDRFLLLDFAHGQNPRYFEKYDEDIRNILQFSKKMQKDGSDLIRSLKKFSESMCIHVRMTDFVGLSWHSDLNKTVKAANTLAKKKNISHFFIFGDDYHFMANLSQTIVQDGAWKNDAVIISKYQESMDLYLSSKMCGSFLISAAMSTFGWWLAFFSKDQNAVYYLNHTRPNVRVKRSKEFFL